MATLVTGSSGFVCVNVVRALAGSGERVVALDVTPPDAAVHRFLAEVAERVAFVSGDVRDQPLLERVCLEHRVEAVIHGAAVTSTDRQAEAARAALTAAVNLGGTIAALEAARKAGTRRFVYVSSSSVYGSQGSPDSPLTEDAPLRPTGLYGITKVAAERTALRWRELHGLDVVAVRLGGPYGPMERPTHVRAVPSLVHGWAAAALRGERPAIPHLGGFRDWTHVEDTAAGIVAAWRASAPAHRVFNLSAGIPYTPAHLRDAIRAVIPAFDVEVLAEDDGSPEPARDRRGPLDSSRARADLGFTPRHDLRAGVARYLEWLMAGS